MMTDAPEKMKEYPSERTVTWIDDETGQEIGRAEYTRTDQHLALLAAEKREARNEAIQQAILVVNGCDRVSEVQPALRKLMEDTGDD